MPLPSIDLDAMQAVMRRSVDRQFSQYLRESKGQVLSRLPGDPECISNFIVAAGTLARKAGYGAGRSYSVHLLTSFLHGLGWGNDPACTPLQAMTETPGLAVDSRLDLLFQKAIQLRQQHELLLPRMHAINEAVLLLKGKQSDEDTLWSALSNLMSLRGVEKDKYEDCYLLYEADGCARFNLPSLKHHILDGNEILGYRYYGKRLPQPSDALLSLEPESQQGLLHHILLAMSFGRFFHANPLFESLADLQVKSLARAERNYQLRTFLQGHARALMELSHGQ